MRILRRISWVSLAALGGCASPPAPPPAPMPPPAGPAQPANTPMPVAQTALPLLAEPVYRNPKIGVVYLRAHEDADGRLLGPQVMYEVIDAGGWNIEAVEHGKGYVPIVNRETPGNAQAAPIVPARQAQPLSPDAPLMDPELAARTTITGLMRLEDKDEAEAMARRSGDGRIAVFDDQAGWLLVPAPGRPEEGVPVGRQP